MIIPAYNEAPGIGKVIRHLKKVSDTENIKEVIVVDGNSSDGTPDLARRAGAVTIRSSKIRRSVQMNAGAAHTSGELLYFLHADTFPPERFDEKIISYANKGYMAGCFRLSFDHRHWFLQFCSWFTRFNVTSLRFGDQSLYVDREIFRETGGYNEAFILMEDQEIISRIKKKAPFKVIPVPVVTSARRYLANGIFYQQWIYILVYLLYLSGMDQVKLKKWMQKREKNFTKFE